MEIINSQNYSSSDIYGKLKTNFPINNCTIEDEIISFNVGDSKFVIMKIENKIFIDKASKEGNYFIALIIGAIVFAIMKVMFGIGASIITSILFVIGVGLIQKAISPPATISKEDDLVLKNVSKILTE